MRCHVAAYDRPPTHEICRISLRICRCSWHQCGVIVGRRMFFRIKPSGERRYLQIVENTRHALTRRRHPRTRRGPRSRRQARCPTALRRTALRDRAADLQPAGRNPRGLRHRTHRCADDLRPAVGADRVRRGDRTPRRRPRLRLLARTRGVRQCAAPADGIRLGPRLRGVAGRLSCPGCRRARVASPLSRHGLAGGGADRSERRHTGTAADQGSDRGSPVRTPAHSVLRPPGRAVRHHLPDVQRQRWRKPRSARRLQGPSARPASGGGRRRARRGRPICSEAWPGNATDVKSLLPVIARLRDRFGIRHLCVVADRGMISAETIAELEARGIDYILGARERSTTEIREVVLTDRALMVPLTIPRARGSELDIAVKEVIAGDWGPGTKPRRYVVCFNPAEARRDAAGRETILASLRSKLKAGDKELVGNAGYRRFLASPEEGHFEIDAARIADDARFDGLHVLRTNSSLNMLSVALAYRELWRVEAIFRTAKSILETRPIFHQSDAAIAGHLFCSFLALLLRKELDERLAAANMNAEWGDVVRDLDRVEQVTVEQGGKRFVLRPQAPGCAGGVFKAVGVALPHWSSNCRTLRRRPGRHPCHCRATAGDRGVVPRAAEFPGFLFVLNHFRIRGVQLQPQA